MLRLKKALMIVGSLILTNVAFAQFTNKSSVLDGSGTISTGGTYTNISAAGQPGGIAVSSQGTYVNQAGFLQTFFINGSLDTDGDGLADEADLDNDSDGLADSTEISGGSFSPGTVTEVNIADTDGDGLNDGSEATAGTDPTDENAVLEIVSITNTAGGRNVSWVARGNNQRTYRLRATDNSYTTPDTSDIVYSNTVAGGSAPWYVVTNTITVASSTNAEFFVVDVTQ